MIRLLALLAPLIALQLGCSRTDGGSPDAPPPGELPDDPVLAARAWLTSEVFAERTQMTFAPGLDRGAFPARLMVDRPGEYRFIDIWRVRTVDQRLLIDALVQIANEPHVVSFWMEQVSGVWRIAGWRPQATAAKEDKAPPGGVDLPPTLAASAFRGAPPAKVVPFVVDAAVTAETSESAMRVGFKKFTWQGDCPRAKVAAQLKLQTRRLARCHADALGDEARPGRLTFSVRISPDTVDAQMTEATLVAGALTDCVEAALERIKLSKVVDCEVTVPVTFAPRTR